MKIVVLESLSVGEDISWEPLRQFGELTLCRDLTQNDIKEAIKDADIIIPNKLLINKEVLSGSSVKAVFEAATGYNNIVPTTVTKTILPLQMSVATQLTALSSTLSHFFFHCMKKLIITIHLSKTELILQQIISVTLAELSMNYVEKDGELQDLAP